MTYRPYQWTKLVQARKRALVHIILNNRTQQCNCKKAS